MVYISHGAGFLPLTVWWMTIFFSKGDSSKNVASWITRILMFLVCLGSKKSIHRHSTRPNVWTWNFFSSAPSSWTFWKRSFWRPSTWGLCKTAGCLHAFFWKIVHLSDLPEEEFNKSLSCVILFPESRVSSFFNGFERETQSNKK